MLILLFISTLCFCKFQQHYFYGHFLTLLRHSQIPCLIKLSNKLPYQRFEVLRSLWSIPAKSIIVFIYVESLLTPTTCAENFGFPEVFYSRLSNRSSVALTCFRDERKIVWKETCDIPRIFFFFCLPTELLFYVHPCR